MHPTKKINLLEESKPANRIDLQAAETKNWKKDLLLLQEDINSIIGKLVDHQLNINKHQERLYRYKDQLAKIVEPIDYQDLHATRESGSHEENLKGELIAKHHQLADYHHKLTTVVRLLNQTI